ncbi:hypothetical protein V6N13_049297 [Hibiscus sabdariffa]
MMFLALMKLKADDFAVAGFQSLAGNRLVDRERKRVLSPIISDTKEASKNFERLTFSYVGRKGNEPAHELAKIGLQYREPRYWIEEVPASVDRLAQREQPP